MKTLKKILEENEQDMIPTYTGKYWGTGTVIGMMREYTTEVLRDYELWKAHGHPELVERYIKEKL